MPRGKDLKETVKEKAKPGRASISSVSEETNSAEKPDTSEKSEKQIKIDKMLTQTKEDTKESSKGKCFDDIFSAIQSLEGRINKLASKEYIDKSLLKVVSADFVSEKMKELKEELSKEIRVELDKAYDSMRKIKVKLTDSQNTIDELNDRFSTMKIDIDYVKKQNVSLDKKAKELSERLKEKDECIKAQERSLNDLEQYTRRNSVRIYGLPDNNKFENIEETSNLVISSLISKLNLKLVTGDIDISHRLGKFAKDANRPVICKFVSRTVKKSVLGARRQLKGTSMVIREDLTFRNAKLLESVSEKEEVQNAWSDDGKILAVLHDGKKVRFDLRSDLSIPLIPAAELAVLLAAKKTRS